LRLLDLASEHPLLPTFALIMVVYVSCLSGALAAMMAWRGRPAYWVSVLGVALFLLGALWGRGYLSGGAIFAAIAGGVILAVFGVALDLIFGQPYGPAGDGLPS